MTTRELFLRHVAQTSPFPLANTITRAKGCFLYDDQDRPILDLISGIAVSSLGHSHPNIVAAIHQQADKYLHTLVYGEFALSPQAELAALLTTTLPPHLDSVYFVSSGAEAVEGAMKLAKRYTGRKEIIACRNAYHGSTQGAMSLNSSDFFTEKYQPLLPNIRHIDYNSLAYLSQITHQTAAVIVETIRGEIGIEAPQNGYLMALRERCNETGTLLIFDEIQCGMGRTGKMWAFEHYHVTPDVLLTAKALGAGLPLGAFIANKKVMEVLSDNPILGHITTFGGNPLCCAASLAMLKTLLSEKHLLEEVPKKADLFHTLLSDCKGVKAIRNVGLMMAVEIRDFEQVMSVCKASLEDGLLVDWFLFNDRSLRLAPPLIITETEIRWACEVLRRHIEK